MYSTMMSIGLKQLTVLSDDRTKTIDHNKVRTMIGAASAIHCRSFAGESNAVDSAVLTFWVRPACVHACVCVSA